jgi:hypothetical protein
MERVAPESVGVVGTLVSSRFFLDKVDPDIGSLHAACREGMDQGDLGQ